VGLAFADMRDGAESIAEKDVGILCAEIGNAVRDSVCCSRERETESIAEKELDVVEDAERECDAEAEYVDVAEREEDGIAEKDGAECCKEE
jgi:hypothetical protein